MKLRSLLGTAAAVAVTAIVGLGLATPALATYAPENDAAHVSATTVAKGGQVTVSGDHFCPGTDVTVTVGQGGSVYITHVVQANASGNVSVTLTLDQVGVNNVRLRGRQSDCTGARVLGVKVTVQAAGAGAGLPRTGGVDFTPLWAGLGLLVSGALLVSVAHSRRRVLV